MRPSFFALRALISLSLFGSLLATAADAFAADSSTLGPALTLRPTLNSVGITASVTGDDDGDAKVSVAFRKVGDSTFLPGHVLLPVSGSRYIGSALFLAAGTDYEIKVTLDDPDNAGSQEAMGTVRTRDDAPPPQGGKSIYVDAAKGSDSNDGSPQKPLQTIQAAADIAGPGMVIHVAPGIYRETVTFEGSHGGAKGSPLWILADPGAIIDGSDPALEDGSIFKSEGNGIYSAPFSGLTQYVAVDDMRIYDYSSLADLQSEAAGLPGGFFADSGAGKLYLKLPDGSSPSGHKVHVAIRNVGILLDTLTDVVVEGFEIRYLGSDYEGAAVDVRDTARSWVRKNNLHHMNAGVRVRRPLAAENVIEENTIRDTSVWTWPWEAVKAHTPEASAVSLTGGGGNVVRRNQTSGNFNGVYVGDFEDASEDIAPDSDIYENVMTEHGDDVLEPEGACVNVRFWNNFARGVYHGLSLAPIVVGPLFAVRNVFDGYKAHALKVNNAPTGWVLVYHTTSIPAPGIDTAQAIEPIEPFMHLVTRNNIWTGHRYVIESGVDPSGPVDLDWDNLWTDTLDQTPRFVKWMNVKYADIAELKSSGTIEGNGFQIEPAYEDAAGGDFTPVKGSGLLDVGVVIDGINDRFFVGAAPDIGAFERGGVSPLPDGGVPDGGSGAGSGGGSSASAGSGGASSASGGANDGSPGDDGGCGCRFGDGAAEGVAVNAIGALIAGILLRRRRRAPRGSL